MSYQFSISDIINYKFSSLLLTISQFHGSEVCHSTTSFSEGIRRPTWRCQLAWALFIWHFTWKSISKTIDMTSRIQFSTVVRLSLFLHRTSSFSASTDSSHLSSWLTSIFRASNNRSQSFPVWIWHPFLPRKKSLLSRNDHVITLSLPKQSV